MKRTKKYLKISDIVLDYGCGTGLISNEIAEYVKGIQEHRPIADEGTNNDDFHEILRIGSLATLTGRLVGKS